MAILETVRAAKARVQSSRARPYLRAAAYFALGFFFSLGSALGELHPFGVSAVAVSKKRDCPLTVLGAVLATLLSGVNAATLRYMAALILCGLCAVGIDLLGLRTRPVYTMGAAFLSSALTGAVLSAATGGTPWVYLLAAAEAVLSAGGAYFLYRALGANIRRLRFRALPLSEVSCLMISVSLLLMNLASLRVGKIAPAVAVAVLLLLIAVRYFGERYALILALSFGFVISLESTGGLYKIGALAFSVMVCALFSALPDLGISLAFLCSVGFFCVASSAENALGFFLEAAVGAVAFVLLPARVTAQLEAAADTGTDAPPDGTLRQSLVLKLKFAGAAMSAISESVNTVREKMTEVSRRENARHRASMTEEEYASRELILEKTNQIRMVASDQLFSVSDMLQSLAGEFDEAEIFDGIAAARIRRLLGDSDIYPQSISVIEDKYGRMRVEVLADSACEGLKNPALNAEIGKICNRYFSRGKITYFNEDAMLSFFEKPNYRLQVGFAQYSADGGMCGDTVKIINDNKGHSILIISDGMGKGARAALDGAMGAGLLSKLINAGFGFDASLKIVNSALLVKSNDESLATLDIANIDLFTGRCELLKAGAPASYIIKDARLTRCELSSMPAGILRGIEFARRTAVLSPGNRIVLMSDGITDLGEAFLKDVLSSLNDRGAQDCADIILEKALAMSEDRRRDDMSVIVAQLEQNEI